MPEESRVKRWRENKRQQGLKHVSVWLTPEEELRLKDLAVSGDLKLYQHRQFEDG